jgi:hypothetical protein
LNRANDSGCTDPSTQNCQCVNPGSCY